MRLAFLKNQLAPSCAVGIASTAIGLGRLRYPTPATPLPLTSRYAHLAGGLHLAQKGVSVAIFNPDEQSQEAHAFLSRLHSSSGRISSAGAEASLASRLDSVRFAERNVGLEGLSVGDSAGRLADRFIQGTITLEELVR